MEISDYRRGNPDYLRGEGSVLLPIQPQQSVQHGPAAYASYPAGRPAPHGPRVLPRLWLAFLPLYWFPQRINWGLIGTYLIPFQVVAIVGDQRKHVAYSMYAATASPPSHHPPISSTRHPSNCLGQAL